MCLAKSGVQILQPLPLPRVEGSRSQVEVEMNMRLLSRAELIELQQELEEVGKEEKRGDDALMRETSATAEAWQPIFGYSEVLLRHIAAICGYLRSGLEGGTRDRARGALALISRELGRVGESRPLEGQVLAFVAGFVAHELRESESARVSYRPFQLSREDRQAAEDLLMKFYERPSFSDEELLVLCKRFADQHTRLQGSNFFGRLLLNLSSLEKLLQAEGTDPENRSWIRAALAYIVEAEDAIDDRMGLLGLLDDAFVAALVTSIVRPEAPPWTEILDQLYGAWPFIDEVVLHGEHAGRPLTEFLAINVALVCKDLRTDPDEPLALVFPDAGPMPLLLGVFSAIGLIQDWLKGSTSPLQFEVGQTVRLDNQVSAHYMGTEKFEGVERIALRFWNSKGFEETALFPLSDRPRLTPAKPEKRPRGPIDQTSKRISHLSALEHLFHLDRPRALSELKTKVLLVAPVGRTRDLASEIHLCGLPLHGALPMGRRRDNGRVEPWDKKYSALPPVLEIAPRLQEALRQVTANPEQISLVIVDLRGSIAGKISEIDELICSGVPLVLVTEEHEERAIAFLEQSQIRHWVWAPGDLEALVWPEPNTHLSTVGRYEDRMRLGAVATTRAMLFEDPLVEQVVERLYALRRYPARYHSEGEEVPTDLSRSIVLAESWTFPLLRLDSTLGAQGQQEQAKMDLLEMLETADLADDELSDLQLFWEAAKVAQENLRITSPRMDAALKLMIEDPEARLLVRDEREREAVLDSTNLKYRRVSTFANPGFESATTQLVVPGWLGSRRMVRLLIPPAATSIGLVLNATELRWFQTFQMRRENLHRRYAHANERKRIFPDLQWQSREIEDALGRKTEDSGERQDLYESRRDNVLANERWNEPEGGKCSANLVLFEGHSFAFLTPSFKVPAISFGHGKGASLDEHCSVVDLRRGDPLFLATEAFDCLVYEISAKNLLPGALEMSRLWHGALKRFLDKEYPGEFFETGLSELQKRLEAEGCRRHLATIRAWVRSETTVAPQDAEEDLAAIAKATGDHTLADQLDKCLTAVQEVYRARKKARRKLRRDAFVALRAIFEQRDDAWREFDSRQAFKVVWLADIEPESRRVPRALTNKIIREDSS